MEGGEEDCGGHADGVLLNVSEVLKWDVFVCVGLDGGLVRLGCRVSGRAQQGCIFCRPLD